MNGRRRLSMDQDTIEGLLECLDKTIVRREKSYETLDKEFKNVNGHVLSKEYDDYKERKDRIEVRFSKDAVECQRKLDALCKKVRKKQPVLTELQPEYINQNGRFPRRIALGKFHVQYENLDIYVPKTFEFPLKKPMYICDEQQMGLLHKVILRLMYSLPADKQEYYVFDPIGLGKSMWMFNRLFANEKLFSQKKVMSNAGELKTALKAVMDYMQNLYSYTFDLQTDCPDWDSYNRRLYSQKNTKKMLPYKVFIFMDVPDGMDAECFEMFRKLLLHSEKCGFLVLFSFNQVLLEAEDSKMKVQEMQLEQCVESSLPLHSVFDRDIANFSYEKLKINSIGEKFPDDKLFDYLLSELDSVVKNNTNSMFSFDDMLPNTNLFGKKSNEKLLIPCGYTTTGGAEVSLDIGDRYPHYLIGGTTGSGKSNLLHNIIMNACWNYSPEELRVYLLDFKEGVEFSRYADPVLKHAMLVATEANKEYGISALRHLVQEKTRRYSLFKNSGCKDIQAYRQLNPTEIMPRILVIVDEFQVLFEGTDKDKTIEKLSMLAKQGRACGIHLILATQSLKGIDFGNLAPQFSGRIALKSSAEDSKLLLGGITSNNEEASELEIPYAILNTSQGSVSGNVKYAVPEAKSLVIGEKLHSIAQECLRQRIATETKIFEGQRFPEFPEAESFTCDEGYELLLGETLDYEAEELRIKLKNALENNVIFCGHDDQMKKDFIDAIVLSSAGCKDCEELVYIGDSAIQECEFSGSSTFLINFANMKEFVEANKSQYFGRSRLIILDNVNLAKEMGFPITTYPKPSEETLAFKEFWDEANRHGNHFIAFYEGMNRIKASGIPVNDFRYRIGYSLNSDEKNQFLGNTSYASKEPEKRRAFLADNLSIEAWFRPFENNVED
jgi:DNA segregation ATPase FtsK/SpoIIIE, S-DNA-T family